MVEEAALRELLDKQAIRDLVQRYCRAIDRRDFALLRTLYHAEAIDDHGDYFCGPAREFIDRLPGIMAGNRVTSHNVCNMLIETEGDYAEGEIYTLAYHLSETDGEATDFLVGGRYLDRYIRDGGAWKFLHRKIVMDWNQLAPSRCDLESFANGATAMGRADAGDPSYGYFRLLRRADA